MLGLVLVLSLGLGWQVTASSETKTQQIESVMSEWLSIERQSDHLSGAWQGQKLLLEQRIDLLRLEEKKLTEKLNKHSTSETKTQQVRLDLARQQTKYEAGQRETTQALSHMYLQIVDLLPRLPVPLSLYWQQALDSLDQARESASASRRLEAYLKMYVAMAEFETKLTRHQTVMSFGTEKLAVEQFYLGLGAAWYLSQDGRYAGFGHGHGAVWQWQADNSLVPQVTKLKHALENPETNELVDMTFVLAGAAE